MRESNIIKQPFIVKYFQEFYQVDFLQNLIQKGLGAHPSPGDDPTSQPPNGRPVEKKSRVEEEKPVAKGQTDEAVGNKAEDTATVAKGPCPGATAAVQHPDPPQEPRSGEVAPVGKKATPARAPRGLVILRQGQQSRAQREAGQPQ
ncbi:UNVERIFIED_CONTAM: hypothetical protein K2H54_024452 [Gekko kuhli]